MPTDKTHLTYDDEIGRSGIIPIFLVSTSFAIVASWRGWTRRLRRLARLDVLETTIPAEDG